MAPKGAMAASEIISNKNLTYAALVGLMLYVLVRSLFAAAGKSFWYDEVLTLAVASQGSWKGIVTALHAPIDGQPPLFYIVERLASRSDSKSTNSLSFTFYRCFSIHGNVRFHLRKGTGKRDGRSALRGAAANDQRVSDVFSRGETVQHAGGLFRVCAGLLPAFAINGLDLVIGGDPRVGSVLSLLCCIGHGSVWLSGSRCILQERESFVWPVWGALCFGVLPLVLEWKILAIDRDFYGPHFWAHFSFTDLPRMYGEFFLEPSSFGGGIVVLSLVAIVWTYIGSLTKAERQGEATPEGLSQTVLLSGFILLPLIAYLTTRAMHSGLTTRYVLPTVIGFVLTFGFMLSRASGKAVVLSAVFVLSCVGVHEIHFWRFVVRDIRDVRSRGAMVQKLINSAGHPELPILVPDVFIYLPLAYYSSAGLRDRLAFLPYPSRERQVGRHQQEHGFAAILLARSSARRIRFYEFESSVSGLFGEVIGTTGSQPV